MEQWSPFRRRDKPREQAPRSRGRRRQRLAQAPDDPDAVLTDRDAAHAAQTARQDRARPQARAWERFSSEPVTPRRRLADHGDAVLSVRQAEREGAAAVMGQAASTGRAKAGPDYGTGPAYEIGSMNRQQPEPR